MGAYIVGVENDVREKPKAEGAVFAAAVLPMVDFCNADDAKIIYKNMQVGATLLPRFKDVKRAFERNYNCLGITCADVGGLVDKTRGKKYLYGAEPCGVVSSEQGYSSNNALLAIIIVVVLCCSWKNKTKKEFDVTTDDVPVPE